MPSLPTENVDQEREKLGETETTAPQEVDFRFLNKQDNKTTKLLSNSGSTSPVKGKKRWFEYGFKEPIFVTSVVVHCSSYGRYDTFEIEWESVTGEISSERVSPVGDTVKFSINDLVSSVRFQPPSLWLLSPKINFVEMYGFPKENLSSYIKQVDELERYRDNIAEYCDQLISNAKSENDRVSSLEQKQLEISDRIANLQSEESEIQSRIGRLSEEKNALDSSIASLNSAVKDSEERLSRVDEEVSNKTNERKNITDEITDKKSELKKLQDDVNMFPTELSGFAEQSSRNISLYVKLSSVPIAIILIMFVLLVKGAADLTTVMNRNEGIDIYSIFVTRLPYVLIATAIIAACYKISRVFIEEIMRITQQKLNLTKISIIASEVSNAADDGLEMSDEEKFGLRTHLKMNLLRDHLKTYLSKDFSLPLPKSLMLGSRQPIGDPDTIGDTPTDSDDAENLADSEDTS